LVTAINVRLSSEGQARYRLDPTAGYSWVKQGYRPRSPIPDVAAAVLSEQLGFLVTAAQLWPGRGGSAVVEPAVGDLGGAVSVGGLLEKLAGLTVTTNAAGGGFGDASGADLIAAVSDPGDSEVRLRRYRPDREFVSEHQVALLAAHVAALRRLDDRHGGGALSLRYVSAELRNVIDLAGYASYEPEVGRQLLAIIADLGQLLGWLQFDSGRYGAAERYLLLSVRVCRSLAASDRAANAIGMLSYVSAFAGHGVDALRLVEAAHRECPDADPVLRARLLGREATAAAADGDHGRFRQASASAMELLAGHRRHGAAPSFLYYLAPEQLAAETGQGLVVLAERTTSSRQRLLDEAVDTLSAALAGLAQPVGEQHQSGYPRSALLHSTFLAKAQLMRGDLEQAAHATRYALGHLGEVQSPRGRAYLRALRPALARRSRSGLIAELLPDFDKALSPV
jgi:hypothetical protein